MEFETTRWSCPWRSDQNCKQNPARGWWGLRGWWVGGLGSAGGPGSTGVVGLKWWWGSRGWYEVLGWWSMELLWSMECLGQRWCRSRGWWGSRGSVSRCQSIDRLSKFGCFIWKICRTRLIFISLFWTSGDVCPWFSKSGWIPRLSCNGWPRFKSGATPCGILAAETVLFVV